VAERPAFTVEEETTDVGTRVRRYRPVGFWNEAVRVEQRPRRPWDKSGTLGAYLRPEVSWSMGGRDPEQEPDDLKAAENFHAALGDALEVAKRWDRDTGKVPKGGQRP
jgi:hypothetical protein